MVSFNSLTISFVFMLSVFADAIPKNNSNDNSFNHLMNGNNSDVPAENQLSFRPTAKTTQPSKAKANAPSKRRTKSPVRRTTRRPTIRTTRRTTRRPTTRTTKTKPTRKPKVDCFPVCLLYHGCVAGATAAGIIAQRFGAKFVANYLAKNCPHDNCKC